MCYCFGYKYHSRGAFSQKIEKLHINMKNLQLLYLEKRHAERGIVDKVALHPYEDVQYLATSAGIYALHQQSSKILPFADSIADFHHITSSNALCVALNNGSVYLADATSLEILEEATFCPDGIEIMEFSPDQEVVVFVTRYEFIIII